MSGVIGFVIAEILTEPEMILYPLYKFLDSKIGKYPYLFKPIIGCGKCVAGQVGLWGCIFAQSKNIDLDFYLILKTAGFIIYGTSLSILIAWKLTNLKH